LLLLIAAAATDLVDGRVARALKVTSNIGGGLDTTADKVFALSLMLKLAESAVLPWWILAISLAQYLTLAAVGSIYSRRFHHIPVPEQSAHTAAVLAVAAVIVGVATVNIFWTTALAICLMLANLWHISVAWRRTASIQG
jgi:phosphatidylglycerophosphate synthase